VAVEHDDVRSRPAEQLEQLAPVRRPADREEARLRAQHRLEAGAEDGVIVDDQDADHRAAHPFSAARDPSYG
jgi:hypothetical protein